MREIKFRVWDIVWGKMRYNKDLWDIPYNEIFIHTPDQRALNLMQYIGIKDEDAKDIYEGDVVERVDRTPIAHMYGKIVIGIVGFDNGSFVLNTDEGVYSMDNNKLSNTCSYRVIGNIYENPELIG